MANSSDHFQTKKSTIIFLVLAAVIVLVIIIFCIINSKKNGQETMTVDYDMVYTLGSYNMKINSMAYFTDKKELDFIYYCKKAKYTNEKTNKPTVCEVRFHYDLEGKKTQQFPFSSETLNDVQSLYKVENVEIADVKIVYVVLEYKDDDYYDPDKVDEFGDVTKGEFHEGETHYFYISVDIRDLLQITSSEYVVPALNDDEMDKGEPVTTTANGSDKSVDNSSDNEDSEAINKTTIKTTTVTTENNDPAPSVFQTTAGTTINNNNDPSPSSHHNTTRATTIADNNDPAPSGHQDTTITTIVNNNDPAPSGHQITTITTIADNKDAAPSSTQNSTSTKRSTTTTKKTTAKPTTSFTTTAKNSTATTTETTKASSSGNHAVKLALDQHQVNLVIGETAELKPIYEPTNSTDTFSWKSNRTDRVTVDENGKVKAVGTGSAIITCTDNETGLTASCMVTVK